MPFPDQRFMSDLEKSIIQVVVHVPATTSRYHPLRSWKQLFIMYRLVIAASPSDSKS